MKGLNRNKGDPRYARRLAVRVAGAAVVAGVLLLLGVAQALSAAVIDGASGRSSGQSRHRPPGGFEREAVFLPRIDGVRRPGKHPGFLDPICETKNCPKPPLVYLGAGGVQEEPTLRLILWGSNWKTAEPGSKVRGALAKLYESLSGSAYQGILTQYFSSKGRIGTKVTLTTYIDTKVTAPTGVNDSKIQAEVSSAITANSWKRETNAQFIVVPAPGSTYEESFSEFKSKIDFCAYHDETEVGASSYSFVPYMGDAPFTKGCGNEGTTKEAETATTAAASHEYAESATDPNPELFKSTWRSADIKYEITDICDKENLLLFGGVGVQAQWDNSKGECTLEDASPAFVYAFTERATKVTETAATLRGEVNPEGMSTEYFFEYGTTTKYGSNTALTSAGSGKSVMEVSATVTGLSKKTLYHFQLVAKNSKGKMKGWDQTGKTS